MSLDGLSIVRALLPKAAAAVVLIGPIAFPGQTRELVMRAATDRAAAWTAAAERALQPTLEHAGSDHARDPRR